MKKIIFILPLIVFAYVTEWAVTPQRGLANQAQPKSETVALSSSNWDHTLDVGDTPKDIRVILPEHYQAKVTIGSASKKKGQQAVSYKMFKGMAETIKSIPNGKVSIKVELIPLRPEVVGKPAPPYQVEEIETPWAKKRSSKKDLPIRVIIPGITTDFKTLGTPSQRRNTVPDISKWPAKWANFHRLSFRYEGETPVTRWKSIDDLPFTIGPGPFTVDSKNWPSYLRGELFFYSEDKRYKCKFLINYSSLQIQAEGLNPRNYMKFCNPGVRVNGYLYLYKYDNRLKNRRCRTCRTLKITGSRPSNYLKATKQSPLDLTYLTLWPDGRYQGPLFPAKNF